MLDTGDKMMRLSLLENGMDEASFTHYFSLWIYIFDAPVYTVVDLGTIIAVQDMADKLRDLQAQLSAITSETPWSLDDNERSLRFINEAINKFIYHKPSIHSTRILGGIEMA